MNTFGTPESIGESNKKLILRNLRELGHMSRADLSRQIGMSFTAISSNVKYLLEHGYIQEIGAGDNSHGRKSTLLSFNAKRGHVVGVDIGRSKIRFMLADLLGRPVAGETVDLTPDESGKTGEGVINTVTEIIANLAAAAGVQPGRIICVCIGLPGVVRDGRIYLAPFFADFSVEQLRKRIKTEFGSEALVENGVNLGGWGEHLGAVGSRFSDMIYVSYGVGLGSALILGGKLHAGTNNAAGEIGFLQLDPALVSQRFDEIGPLEGAISPDKLPCRHGPASSRDVIRLLEDFDKGMKTATKLVESVSISFAMAITNLAAVVNPQAIIVSGGVGKALGERFLDEWKAHLARSLPFPPEIMMSDLNGRETMLGAVGTAADYVWSLPIGQK